jgi:hypothetical protein
MPSAIGKAVVATKQQQAAPLPFDVFSTWPTPRATRKRQKFKPKVVKNDQPDEPDAA